MHDIFYFTDIHGCYDLYRAAMDYCLEQDPECTIIFGGDACDRGAAGYRIMKELLDSPQVIYLKGNHEDMFVSAAVEILKDYKDPRDALHAINYLHANGTQDNGIPEIKLVIANGGFDTLRDWIIDGMPKDIIKDLVNLPVTIIYNDIDICHAGGRYKDFQAVANAEYNGEFPDPHDEVMLLWDRNYIGQGWAPNRTCIFGHTPTTYVAAKYYGRDKSLAKIHPCAYNATLDNKWTGRKIAMDTGAVASGRLYVLNLLTMQAQGFRDTYIGNDEIRKHNIEKIEMIQF